MMRRIVFILVVSGLAFAVSSSGAQAPDDTGAAVEKAPVPMPPPVSAPEKQKTARAQSPATDTKAAEGTAPEIKAIENSAESRPPDGGGTRYTFSRVQDGYLRLDSHTGQVSLCSKRAVGWACQMLPEDRNAFETEIARLQDENAVLKKDLPARGLALPGDVKPDSALAQRDPIFRIPSDAQIERVKGIIEKAWHRLVEMIANLQKDVLKKS
jgi:hypothetical protein